MAKREAKPVKLDASMRVVVLYGEERFLIEEYTKQLAGMLSEAFGGVEQFTFDGETVAPSLLLDELRSYGLMQRHKLVILEHADAFLAGGGKGARESDDDGEGDGDGATEKSSRRPIMERYVESPVADATLVMRAESWRAGKIDKLIEKVGGVFHCPLQSPATAAGWLVSRCNRRYDTTINPDAAALLVERLGTELMHLASELNKLAAMAGKGQPITREMVAESVGLSREEKAWEMQGAILSHPTEAEPMLRKLRELLDISRQDEVPITWSITDLMRKLHAASQLLKRRVPPPAVMGQAKLFGPTAGAMMELARTREPDVFAQLLQECITVDMHTKSGVGDPQRSLEGLLIKIADSL